MKPIIINASEIDRFWKTVEIGSVEECWPWTGRSSDGYGAFYTHRAGKRVGYAAHRVSLFIKTGMLGHSARHSCDNPICCNPNHLEWGTNQDNVNDRNSRNRQSKEEGHGMAKLDRAKVLSIREAFEQGIPKKDLASQYGVTVENIHAVVTRKTWKNV